MRLRNTDRERARDPHRDIQILPLTISPQKSKTRERARRSCRRFLDKCCRLVKSRTARFDVILAVPIRPPRVFHAACMTESEAGIQELNIYRQ
jgi:hypothetical protein